MSDALRRAFLSDVPAPGGRADLDPEEAHHVARVLRLRAGDAVSLFDGKGGEWEATIEAASKDRVTVVVGAARQGDVEPPIRLTLFQALARPEKIEWVLQKGTEIGVSAFRLIATRRVEAPVPSPSRVTRYERIVMEACKQCGRRTLPSVSMGTLQAPSADAVALILSTASGAAPLGALLAGPKPKEVWLAVGPEGGFDAGEVDAAVASGWRPASLGPRVLRTETAGAVASAIVLHAWGDLGAGKTV